MNKLKTIVLFSLVAAALTNNAFAAAGASSLSANGITNPTLGVTNYTGNNANIANAAYGSAYVNARHTQMTATPTVNPPTTPASAPVPAPALASAPSPAPSYFRDTTRGGNNNHDHGSSDHGGRGNGSQNAQNSHSAGGFGTSGDHIGGGRTGGGFHY